MSKLKSLFSAWAYTLIVFVVALFTLQYPTVLLDKEPSMFGHVMCCLFLAAAMDKLSDLFVDTVSILLDLGDRDENISR